MKRALGLAMLGLFLLVQPVAASDYTISGKARYNDRLVVDFTTAGGDVSAVATWSGNTKWGKVWLYNVDVPAECQALSSTRPVSCTIVNGPAGHYRAEFWPNTQVSAALTVHAAD